MTQRDGSNWERENVCEHIEYLVYLPYLNLNQFINLASGSKLDVGTSLKSCTEEVQVSKQFTVDDRPVVLVDTPGFHDTFKSDMDVLNSIAQWMAMR